MQLIPTVSKIMSGNKPRAAHYLGLAQRQLDILLRQMKLSVPMALPSGQRKLKLADGTLIIVSVSYNSHTMRIHVPLFGGEKEVTKYCFSVPHFALGKITAVYPSLAEDYTEEEYDAYIEDLHDRRITYDLDICTGEFYIISEGVLDANFGRYYVGQKVLVTIGSDEVGWRYPLDPYRDYLMDAERFSILMISPLSVADMDIWRANGL